MRRYMFACVPLLLLSVQPPVYAKERKSDSSETKCTPKKKKKSGGMFGAIAGGIASSALGGWGGAPGALIAAGLPVASLLTDAIIRKLDCKEQVQAATATDNAVRGGVGTTSTWESESRPGVKGSSTVVAANTQAGGGSCMTVNDVVIVDGEETTVSKRMCRNPGASGYTLAA